MKNILKNKTTGEEHLCDKVTIDGFDYYVSTWEKATEDFYGYINFQGGDVKKVGKYFADDWKKIIATNNLNIDIPKVVDKLSEDIIPQIAADLGYRILPDDLEEGIKAGYQESQETHPNSDEDMVEFNEWYYNTFLDDLIGLNGKERMDKYQHLKNQGITKEIIQIWREQKIKTIYYE